MRFKTLEKGGKVRGTYYFYIGLFSVILFSGFSFSLSFLDFKNLIQGYAKNSGVRMDFEKKTYLKLLHKTKTSKGEIFLSKGSILLKIEDPLKTKIIFDGKHLWYITSPAGEKKQVLEWDIQTSLKNKSLLSFLFHPHLLFQNFRVVHSRPKGRTWIFQFEPIHNNSEIQSFSVKVDGKRILTAWIKWKNLGNEEKYTFSNIQFNQKIPLKYFQVSKK
ncbi:MAG: outer membrane lipoprotein carrier protein LolA [Bdellovibrionaceae bacterium]|nr:outer membrane lipoprotein carrier protein LolA [Pseudobdellovibrionaceae bacterium]